MAKNWIAGATQNKGGLHRSLGVPEGKPIPKARIAAAAKKGGKIGKQARLAETLEGMHHGSSGARGMPHAQADLMAARKRSGR